MSNSKSSSMTAAATISICLALLLANSLRAHAASSAMGQFVFVAAGGVAGGLSLFFVSWFLVLEGIFFGHRKREEAARERGADSLEEPSTYLGTATTDIAEDIKHESRINKKGRRIETIRRDNELQEVMGRGEIEEAQRAVAIATTQKDMAEIAVAAKQARIILDRLENQGQKRQNFSDDYSSDSSGDED